MQKDVFTRDPGFLENNWLLCWLVNLVRDPSRDVRMGLRSLLDPLNKNVFPIYWKTNWYWYCLLLPILGYWLLLAPIGPGLWFPGSYLPSLGCSWRMGPLKNDRLNPNMSFVRAHILKSFRNWQSNRQSNGQSGLKQFLGRTSWLIQIISGFPGWNPSEATS